MTQEEKAKKYDEALNTAKDCLKDGTITNTAISYIETIFPELKEPDEEKVRKKLIKFFETWNKTNSHCSGVSVNKILAWLEKQGRHANFRNKIQIGDKVTRNEYGVLVNLSQLNRVAEKNKKQGENHDDKYNITGIKSKHAEGKLGEMIKEMKSTDKVEPKFKVKYAGSEYNVLEVKDVSGVAFYGIEDEPNHIDYVKAENCERVDGYNIKENGSTYPTKPAVFSEQKPAWSKDDEEMLDEIIDFFENGTVKLQHDLSLYASWLKSLKDRVKIQQEWTMQDEEELQIALDTLVKAGQHSSAKWLKNVCLVPQNKWKPSDEQMKILLSEVTSWKKGCSKQIVLESLYQDLKKL